MTQFEEELSLASQMQVDEGTDSTQALMKRRCDRRSRLSNALRARLGPQAPGVEGQPCVSKTLKAHLGPSSTIVMLEWPFQPPRKQQVGAPAIRAPLGSISRWLDDMLFMPFDPHIINYESSKGFIVTKFMAYDGSRDPFNHIIHFRQLMTLDIGNDALLWKVFLASLHGNALSWFHRLLQNFVNTFWDISDTFVGHYICSARHKQNISTLQNINL